MIDRTGNSPHSFGVDPDTTTDSNTSDASMLKSVGFAVKHSFRNLKRFEFERAPAKPNEVLRCVPFRYSPGQERCTGTMEHDHV